MATMVEAVELGIPQVWMHRSVDAGSVSPEAAQYGREHGVRVIEGGCPLNAARLEFDGAVFQPSTASAALEMTLTSTCCSRTDPARTNVAKGSGLGLAIVKQIVSGLQGEIWAQQTAGGGLTICIVLPIVEGSV